MRYLHDANLFKEIVAVVGCIFKFVPLWWDEYEYFHSIWVVALFSFLLLRFSISFFIVLRVAGDDDDDDDVCQCVEIWVWQSQ